jgi:hypothetical protein
VTCAKGAPIAVARRAMMRFLLAGFLAAVACSVAFAKSGTFSEFSSSVAAFTQPAPLYTTEQERLVSAIAGSILNIAAFADRFEAGDPFQVRNITSKGRPAKFSLQRRAEVFTVEVGPHIWVPRAYGRLARSFMADGAGLSISEDPAGNGAGAGLPLDAAGDAIRRENSRLSRLLQDHPRSAALHERAALLLAVAAARSATAAEDIRPLLCRMTAHLAVARALHADVLSSDGQLAERLLAQLSAGQAASERQLEPVTAASWMAGPVTFGDAPSLSILPPL